MSEQEGELFSRVYLGRGAPTQDSTRFRLRLFGYLQAHDRNNRWYSISQSVKMNGGLNIVGTSGGFERFLQSAPITDILDFVTLFWRRLNSMASVFAPITDEAAHWLQFVRTALLDENLGYRIDDKCGVHYFVDEEFDRNRVSALHVLDAPQLSAVRDSFESAHRYLDPGSRDTKASVRSAFESLETLARLMFPEQKNLNRWVVENKLKPAAALAAGDDTEKKAVSATFDGLAQVIDGMHLYRHGQPVEQAVAPSIELAVFYLSLTAATLRWMAQLHTHAAVADPVGAAIAHTLKHGRHA